MVDALRIDGGVVFVRPGVAEVRADGVRDEAEQRRAEHHVRGDGDDGQADECDQAFFPAARIGKTDQEQTEDGSDDRIFLLHGK